MGLFSFKKKQLPEAPPPPPPEAPAASSSFDRPREVIPQVLLDLEAGLPALVHHPRPSLELQAQYVALQSLDFSDFAPDVVTRILDVLDTYNQLTLQRDAGAGSSAEALRADLVTLRALLDVGGSTQEIEEQISECESGLSLLVSAHPSDPVISVLTRELEDLRVLWLSRKSVRIVTSPVPVHPAPRIDPVNDEALWERIANSLAQQSLKSTSNESVNQDLPKNTVATPVDVPAPAEEPEPEPEPESIPVADSGMVPTLVRPDPFAVLAGEVQEPDAFGDFADFELPDLEFDPVSVAGPSSVVVEDEHTDQQPPAPEVAEEPQHFDLCVDESPVATEIEPTLDDLNRKLVQADFRLAVLSRDEAKIATLFPLLPVDEADSISDLVDQAHRVLGEAAVVDAVLAMPLNLENVKTAISALDTYPPVTDPFVSRIFPIVPFIASRETKLQTTSLMAWARLSEISRKFRCFAPFLSQKKAVAAFGLWRRTSVDQRRRRAVLASWTNFVSGINGRAKMTLRLLAQEELEKELERELAKLKKEKKISTRFEGKDVVYVADPPPVPAVDEELPVQPTDLPASPNTVTELMKAFEEKSPAKPAQETEQVKVAVAEVDKWELEAHKWRVFRRLTSLVSFTEEQELLRKSVREFARREIGPLVTKMDKEAKLEPELIQKLFSAGFMGIEVGEQYGGAGMSFGDSIIIIEEISRVDPAVGVMVDIHNTLITRSLGLFGSETQKQKFLPRLASDTVGSFCLSEANAGSDAFALKAKAVKLDEAGAFALSGEKLWISNSREANFFVVFARLGNSAEMGAFLVDRSTASEAVQVQKAEKKLGIRASSTCAVNFVEARGERLGGQTDGRRISMSLLNEGRVGIAAQMLGLSKAAFEQSLRHVLTREQFGKRLFDHQAVRFAVAKTHTEISIAEQLIWRAVELKEQQQDVKAAAAMAKLYTTELANRVASEAIDLMGGMGYCSGEGVAEGSSVEKLFRDAKIGTIYEGTSNMQLETIAKALEKSFVNNH